jgi:prefoldin subunit 5
MAVKFLQAMELIASQAAEIKRLRCDIQSAIDHIDVSQRDVLFILQQALNNQTKDSK